MHSEAYKIIQVFENFSDAILRKLTRKTNLLKISRVDSEFLLSLQNGSMDFHNFYTIYVLKVKESIADIPTELRCLSDLENPSQLPVREVLMILSYEFLKFFTPFMFSRSGNPLLIFLKSYLVRVISKI